MGYVSAVKLTFIIVVEATAHLEIDVELSASRLDERHIELVSIEACNDFWTIKMNKVEEFFDECFFRLDVEDSDTTGILRFRIVFKTYDFLSTETKVYDEVSLTVEHKRYHHNAVFLGIWELQRILRRLNIEGQDFEFWHAHKVFSWSYLLNDVVFDVHFEPFACSELRIDADSRMVRNIKLSDAKDGLSAVHNVFSMVVVESQKMVVSISRGCLLAFSAVQHLFYRHTSIRKVSHCLERQLNVAFRLARQMVHLLKINLVDNLDRFIFLNF